MNRLYTFVTASLALIAVLFVLHAAVPPEDPFSDFEKIDHVDLDGYRQSVISGMKLRHSERTKPFDIAIFGNSRALRVTKALLDYGECSFFNFSIQGSSYRNSVAMLEALARRGRAPHLAIISVDNFIIQLATNPMELPVADRWHAILTDLKAAVSMSEVSVRDRLRMILRVLIAEQNNLSQIFNFNMLRRLMRDLGRRLSGIDPLLPDGVEGYKSDGSRFSPLPVNDDKIGPFSPEHIRNILPSYLRLDMQRLADLKAQGTQVILYESPVKSTTEVPQAASDNRRDFLQLCSRLGLSCTLAPDTLPAPAKPWFDNDHAHPEQLTRYVRGLLQQKPPSCAAAS